jgi:Zn-finger nucleic acid-binding protein
MKCPNCDETLVMTERQGIEIDYCPKCRGVWLDKGELDKIIERSSVQSQQELKQNKEKEKKQYEDDDDDDDDGFFGNNRRNNDNPNRRRGGFLGNLFDFD